MKVRKSQDGKRVLGGKLRATSVHRQTNVPRTVRPHKTACPETQKTCREPHTGSPCLETWSICLRKTRSTRCPGRGTEGGTDGDRSQEMQRERGPVWGVGETGETARKMSTLATRSGSNHSEE